MARKKRDNSKTDDEAAATTAIATGQAKQAVNEPTPADDVRHDQPAKGKNWGPSYKALFTSTVLGFEMGEDRRFKQRVFKFSDKPDPKVLTALKDHGFSYRAGDKTWIIPANAETRLASDRLALQFAGRDRSPAG